MVAAEGLEPPIHFWQQLLRLSCMHSTTRPSATQRIGLLMTIMGQGCLHGFVGKHGLLHPT